jgi:hypothetical protein
MADDSTAQKVDPSLVAEIVRRPWLDMALTAEVQIGLALLSPKPRRKRDIGTTVIERRPYVSLIRCTGKPARIIKGSDFGSGTRRKDDLILLT